MSYLSLENKEALKEPKEAHLSKQMQCCNFKDNMKPRLVSLDIGNVKPTLT